MTYLFDKLRKSIEKASLDVAFPTIYQILLSSGKGDTRTPDLSPTIPQDYSQVFNKIFTNGNSVELPVDVSQDGFVCIAGFSSSENAKLEISHGGDNFELINSGRNGELFVHMFKNLDPIRSGERISLNVVAPNEETVGPFVITYSESSMPIKTDFNHKNEVGEGQSSSYHVADSSIESDMYHVGIWDIGNTPSTLSEQTSGPNTILANNVLYGNDSYTPAVIRKGSWENVGNSIVYETGDNTTYEMEFYKVFRDMVIVKFNIQFYADTPPVDQEVSFSYMQQGGRKISVSGPVTGSGEVIRFFHDPIGVIGINIENPKKAHCSISDIEILYSDRFGAFNIGRMADINQSSQVRHTTNHSGPYVSASSQIEYYKND